MVDQKTREIVVITGAAAGVGRATVREWGHIDVWVNDAVTSVFSPFTEMSAEDFRRVTEVTYLGYVYSTMAALKGMIPRDKGRISCR